MTVEEIRDFYLRYVEVANTRAFDRLGEFVHDEVTQNGVPATREVVVASFRQHVEGIPDLKWEIQDLVIEGNRIAARLIDTGTPQREWLGLAPTGASVTFSECAFYEVRDGRFKHMWYMMDADAVRRQLSE
jgi:predicted ester cyclase